MPMVTVQVDARLKQEMEKLNDINWGVVIREVVERKINERGKNIEEALLLNERLCKKAPKDWDSTRMIKAWRQRKLW